MSWLPNPIACDVCGVVKQPSNHWFFARIVQDGPDTVDPSFTIWPWDYPAEDRTKAWVHLCGHACAIRKLNEWMTSTAAEPQRPQLVARPPAEVSSTQENQEFAQPKWTEGGSIKGTE